MTYRKFRVWTGLLLALVSGGAFACEALLKSSPLQIEPSQVFLAKPYENLPHPARLTRTDVDQLLHASLIFPIGDGRDDYWALLFEPDNNKRNLAYRVSGKMIGKKLIIGSIQRASQDEERQYYKRAAAVNGVKGETIITNKLLVHCRDVAISGWVEAKLWLKHRLNPADVLTAINSRFAEPERDTRFNGHASRYRIDGPGPHGGPLRVILADERRCPLTLVTAYEVRQP